MQKLGELPDLTEVLSGQTGAEARKKLAQAQSAFKGTAKLGEGFGKGQPIDVDALLAEPEIELITEEYFDTVCRGKGFSKNAKQKALGYLNGVIKGDDISFGEYVRDMCLSVIDLMDNPKNRTSLEGYFKAVVFCSYLNQGYSQVQAYTRTFPERVRHQQAQGADMKTLSTYASIYASGMAVSAVQARMMIPVHIMYQRNYHLAMATTMEVMQSPKTSPKVKIDAARLVMEQTRAPETSKAELNININQSDAIEELREVMAELSQKQLDTLAEGKQGLGKIAETVLLKDGNMEVLDA